MKDSADRPAVFNHRCLQPPFREITWCPSHMWARAHSRVAAMRNLRDALGQQPVDGADAALWQKNGAYWQPSLHRVPRPWCFQEHIPKASVQTLVLPAACLTSQLGSWNRLLCSVFHSCFSVLKISAATVSMGPHRPGRWWSFSALAGAMTACAVLQIWSNDTTGMLTNIQGL